MIVKIIYFPIGLGLVLIRIGLLVGLIFLRLILTYLQGSQSPITSSLTRLYLISCGVFIMAEGDTSKETIFPVNGVSGCDEFLLALTHPIKSVVSPLSWKFSSILLRICNISLGGRHLAGAARFVFLGSRDIKNLPAQQNVQPISVQLTNFSPFSSSRDESFVLSLLKILSAPISVYELRFLQPIKLADIQPEVPETIPGFIQKTIEESLAAPSRDQLYKTPVVRHPAPNAGSAATSGGGNMPPAFLQRVNAVMEVFPQIDRIAVINDLRATNDLDATIQNILLGKIPNAPETASGGTSGGGVTSGSEQKQFSTDLVEDSLRDGSNPIKSWMSLQQRKTALLQFARAKYLAKHS